MASMPVPMTVNDPGRSVTVIGHLTGARPTALWRPLDVTAAEDGDGIAGLGERDRPGDGAPALDLDEQHRTGRCDCATAQLAERQHPWLAAQARGGQDQNIRVLPRHSAGRRSRRVLGGADGAQHGDDAPSDRGADAGERPRDSIGIVREVHHGMKRLTQVDELHPARNARGPFECLYRQVARQSERVGDGERRGDVGGIVDARMTGAELDGAARRLQPVLACLKRPACIGDPVGGVDRRSVGQRTATAVADLLGKPSTGRVVDVED
jgi:hypothetical protein